MKKIVLIGILIVASFSAKCQKIFSVDYENQADVKVYVVNYENQADIKVFKVKYENQSGTNDGNWFFANYANQAGGRNSSKKDLMY